MAKELTAELQLRNFILQQRAILADIALLDPMSAAYAKKADQLVANLGIDVNLLTKRELEEFVRLFSQEYGALSLRNGTVLQTEIEEYAVLAYAGQAQAFEMAGFALTTVELDRVRVAARNGFVMGHPLTRNLQALGTEMVARTNGSIRDGWVQGRSNADILRDIRGTKFMRTPADGGRRKAFYRIAGSDVGVWRNQAEALVRTGANSYSAQARELFAEQNDDLIDTVLWLAVLDNRTTFICMSLDGRRWPMGSDHPTPPQHWNCRSVLAYLTEGDVADDLFTRASRVPKTQREFDDLSKFRQTDAKARSKIARTRGKQSTTPSFEAFLRDLPQTTSGNKYLKDLLGSEAAVDAFRAGKFTLKDLTKVNGSNVEPLTKTQLRRKYNRINLPPLPRASI